jgi:GNAT superfamily N-acetyltransferase
VTVPIRSIRPFADGDGDRLVAILRRNQQFDWPETEGVAAMRRVAACEAAVFLVADIDGRAEGLIRAVYDGSRALIHLLSVNPDLHHRGIGTALVTAAEAELRRRNAPSVSVTVTEGSREFWRKRGFELLPVSLMLKPRLS